MRIFISYGRKDALGFAQALAGWLREQGHEPWLDRDNGIPVGSPFDVRIELGISDSDILLAVLSGWSLRDEGFCRNELLFAQATRKPIIPVRIADVIPPIQIISLNYVDAAGDPDLAFRELPGIIEQVAATGSVSRRDWPGTEGQAWWALPSRLNFEEELSSHGGSFVGRKWLFDDLAEWVRHPDSRLLLLTCDAGFGKSAAAAQMTARLNVRGVHFCSRSQVESCGAQAWLQSLVYQLAAQFQPYREVVSDLPLPRWNDPPVSLFRTLISDPLRACQHKLDIREPWVVVVDGLDESFAEAGPEMTELLAESADRIPDWLRVIATSRPDQAVISRLQIDNVARKHLDAEGDANLGDLSEYVENRVARLSADGVVSPKAGTAARIADLASGNFLFARMVIEALSDPDPGSRLELDELGTLPVKLGGLYCAMFSRRFRDPKAYESDVRPLLDCLVAAQGPLPAEMLIAASGVDARAAQRGLRALSQFLNRSQRGIGLFHKSVADWLSSPEDSDDFAALSEEGHRRLSDACHSQYEAGPSRMSAYALAHLPAYLTAAERWDDLCAVLTDLDFVDAKSKAGMVHDLVADYNRAIRAWPGQEEKRREEEERQTRIRDYVDRLIAYSGGPDHNPLPEPPRCVEIRTAQRASQRGAGWTPLERVEAWGHFIGNHIRQLADGQERVFQLAWNCAESGPVAERVAEMESDGKGPSEAWLRLRNRPSFTPNPACLRTLKGHTESVHAVSITPDGCRAVSGSVDKTLRVWDLETGESRVLQGHAEDVNAVSITPDGRRAVSGSWDTTLRVWDLESGESRELEGHTLSVNAVSITPDGRRAVSGSWDETVRVWNLETGESRVLQEHPDVVRAVAITPDGRRAVSGSWALRVWDLRTGESRTLEEHAGEVNAVSITPDGRRAVSGSSDRTLRVWDLETGKSRMLEGHTDAVSAVSVTPDGLRAVSGSWDATVRVWDLRTGKSRVLDEHTDVVRAVSITPDGRRAVSGSVDKTLRVWDLEAGESRAQEGHTDAVRAISLTPDGRRAISGSSDRTLRVWDLGTGESRAMEGHTGEVTTAAITPDSRRAVTGSSDRTLRVWDLRTGKSRVLEGHTDAVSAVSVAPNGHHAVSGSADGTLRLWDLRTGESRALEGHTYIVSAVSITPDGRRAVSGSADQTVRLWDLATGESRAMEGHTGGVTAVSVAPEGGRAVSGSGDKTIRLWDLATGESRALEGHTDGVSAVSFTPDGRRVVSASYDKTLRVWDLATGKSRALVGHSNWVRAVSITPDGRCAVSGSADRTIRVWDLESGECIVVCEMESAVKSIAVYGSDVVAGETSGRVDMLVLANYSMGSHVVTASRLWLFDRQTWDAGLSARCCWCGTRFIVKDEWIGREIACPLDGCGKPLSLNPFVCDPSGWLE